MEINLNLNPEDIERAVVEAITASAIGDQLNEIVANSLKDMTDRFDSPLRRAIQTEVHQIIVNTLRDEYGDKIREAVRAHLTDAVVVEVMRTIGPTFESL